MTKYLLDTNVLIAAMKRNPIVLQRLGSTPNTAMFLSTLTHYELWYGVFKSVAHSRNEHRLRETLKEFDQWIPFDDEDAKAAGNIRSQLERAKQTIGPYDTLIAGQALARDLTLVTANEREFRRVPGLRVENWAAQR